MDAMLHILFFYGSECRNIAFMKYFKAKMVVLLKKNTRDIHSAIYMFNTIATGKKMTS
jgi:hypothetical protein